MTPAGAVNPFFSELGRMLDYGVGNTRLNIGMEDGKTGKTFDLAGAVKQVQMLRIVQPLLQRI